MQKSGRTLGESGDGSQTECSTTLRKLKTITCPSSTKIRKRHPEEQMRVADEPKGNTSRGLRAGEEEDAEIIVDAGRSACIVAGYEKWTGFRTARTVPA